MESKITIIDAIMGSGKSTFLINEVSKNSHKKYLIVLPTLKEIERYHNQLSNFIIYDPKNYGHGKLHSLHKLLVAGNSILTTHELIRRSSIETQDLLKKQDYILIIDECLNCIEYYDRLTQDDKVMLLSKGLVQIDAKGCMGWNPNNEHYIGRYSPEMQLCKQESLYTLSAKTLKHIYWLFPRRFFECFEKVIIATYIWKGSIQRKYFEWHNINYDHTTLHDGKLVKYNEALEYDVRRQLKSLISICDIDKLNVIGKDKTALSNSWYKRNKEEDIVFERLRNNVSNYLRNVIGATSKRIIWTTYKSYKQAVQGDGYKKSWIACNQKATNKYAQRDTLAFLCNIYMDVKINTFLTTHGLIVDKDLYSLSELLQWIWRSAIRTGKPINIYVPSSRMRNLLTRWLECKEVG